MNIIQTHILLHSVKLDSRCQIQAIVYYMQMNQTSGVDQQKINNVLYCYGTSCRDDTKDYGDDNSMCMINGRSQYQMVSGA